jgi:hypothetical protein
VALVDSLEECNFGVTREVNVLCAIGDQLHKSTSHLVYSNILFLGKPMTR